MVDKIEISRDIDASPEQVYAAISDVTRMGEWSEECYACEWHEGFDGPVVGATLTVTTAMVTSHGQRKAGSSRPIRAVPSSSSAR